MNTNRAVPGHHPTLEACCAVLCIALQPTLSIKHSPWPCSSWPAPQCPALPQTSPADQAGAMTHHQQPASLRHPHHPSACRRRTDGCKQSNMSSQQRVSGCEGESQVCLPGCAAQKSATSATNTCDGLAHGACIERKLWGRHNQWRMRQICRSGNFQGKQMQPCGTYR